MAIHAGASGDNDTSSQVCEGGLHRAFYSTNPTIREEYINNQSNTVVALDLNNKEDDYEALAKGIGIYNGAAKWMQNYSWPRILKYLKYDPASKKNEEANNICHSCKYSILVRGDSKVFGEKLRTYVWEGGNGVDVNGDKTIADIPDDPETPENEAVIETTVPWCFAYGEKEWVSGQKDADGNTMDFEKYKRRAKVISKYRVHCN